MKILYLLPNLLHEESSWSYSPPSVDALIAESEKGGYQYLKRFHLPQVPIYLLNEHTKNPSELISILEDKVGLISDAGVPCLADPGSELVHAARKKGISIHAVPGPCSIILALQLSGFSGQSFTFHGYFPRDGLPHLPKKISHIFIETPYRTEKRFKQLITTLPKSTQLCVALELMGPHEWVETHTIQEWQKRSIPPGKNRAIFVLFLF